MIADDSPPGAAPPEAPAHAAGASAFIVGVGASAGGLEALGKFFAGMPRASGLAFVVVQHLSPDYKSFMVELLSKKTALPVVRAEDGQEVAPDHVYMIPPGKLLRIYRGRLHLSENDASRAVNLPIDVFFRSLAEDQGNRAIAVVLSGTGSDGTLGVRAIKDAGGLVLVQSEASAQFDGMPRSAISTGLADAVLTPEEMPRQLVQYLQHPFVAQDHQLSRDQSTTELLMQKLFVVLRERCGVDFSGYKPSTIDRRIERRISINQLDGLSEYLRYLESSPREAAVLYGELLIGVTRFYRDRETWEFMAESVLPGVVARASVADGLRVWAPGCSTGEEAYTLAMLLADEIEKQGLALELKLFATDISREAIEAGSLGLYSESVVADIPQQRLLKYFVKDPQGWQVGQRLRRMVVFARHDLLRDPPFTKLDLVSCRNLLIYFQPTLQTKVLALFHFGLRPDGVMLLGSSESLGEQADHFQPLSVKHKVYQSRGERRIAPSMAGSDRLRAGSSGATGLRAAGPGAAGKLLEAVYREVIADYAPACIVLDENNHVVHLLGAAGEYLRLSAGGFTNDIFKLTQHNLATPLATALHRVERDEASDFTFENIAVEHGGARRTVRLRVKALRGRPHDERLRLVYIEEVGPAAPQAAGRVEDFAVEQTTARRIADLEQDLVATKESLQATIEELEAANEELQATNEELLASNEELQSTNEELQSLNEELHTVNGESQQRIEELTELTNDINNLLKTGNVGTVLLDRGLRIRKASTLIYDVTDLRPTDLGVPLEVISRSLRTPEIVELAERAMDTARVCELEVWRPRGAGAAEDGRESSRQCLLLRFSPYKTETGATQGVVLTMVDISERKRQEERLRASQELVAGILNSLPAHVAVVDPQGTILHINEPWVRFARSNGGQLQQHGVGANYFEVCERVRGEDGEVSRAVADGLRKVLSGELPEFELMYPCHAPNARRWFRLHAAPLHGPRSGLVVSHFDVTRAQARGERLVEQLDALLASLGDAAVAERTALTRQLGQLRRELLAPSYPPAQGERP